MGWLDKLLGGNFLGSLVNAGVNVWQNVKNREWSSKESELNRDFQSQMYERQLDDNIAWRTHQEEYNSPTAQIQRYRDAGINPMYAVTGGAGGNSVMTPLSTNGGYGASVPSAQNHRIDFMSNVVQAQKIKAEKAIADAKLKNESKVADAQSEAFKAQAAMYNADAAQKNLDMSKHTYWNKYWQALTNYAIPDSPGYASHIYEIHAQLDANKVEFYRDHYQKMTFDEMKDSLLHSKALRSFARDLNEHQRDLFEYEMKNAKSAAEAFAVAAKWANRNQWINAGTSLLNSAAGMVGAVKGLPFSPYTSNSSGEYHSDNTNRSFNYNFNNR